MGNYKFNEYEVPAHVMKDIRAYVEHGQQVSSFLQAVISNDLYTAVTVADKENYENLIAIVMYLDIEVPARCYGTHAKFNRWCELGGQRGIAKQAEKDNQPPPPPPPKEYA